MLIFLEWIFGVVCIFSSFIYFNFGEYFIGPWFLVFGIALIPPFYKFILPKLFPKFSRAKFLIFSLIIFAFLFVNFIRPIFDKDKILKFAKRYNESGKICLKAINTSQINSQNLKNLNCKEIIKTQHECSLSQNKVKNYLIEDKRSKNIPTIYKLIFIPFAEETQDKFKKYQKQMAITKLKCIILN